MCEVLYMKEIFYFYLKILIFWSVLKNKWILYIYGVFKYKSDKYVFFFLECICKGVISNDLFGICK